jgi:hypothetical protein
MRNLAVILLIACGGCRIGEYIAPPPPDAGGSGDGDGGDLADAAPPDAPGATGLHAIIGERPEWTGSCDALDDRAELEDRFDPAVQEQDVVAGWEFDTGADSYDDATYNFEPAWPTAESGRFSVRFTGRIRLDPGPHCFSIDIGATGTDIVGGKNACGQIWLGEAVAETGYLAATAGPATVCVDVAPEGDGAETIDIVFWYFNIFEQAKLVVRQCAGDACAPDQPIAAADVSPE